MDKFHLRRTAIAPQNRICRNLPCMAPMPSSGAKDSNKGEATPLEIQCTFLIRLILLIFHPMGKLSHRTSEFNGKSMGHSKASMKWSTKVNQHFVSLWKITVTPSGLKP